MLISEACPGYFGDHGTVGTVQPNHGLDTVLGALEDEVEFMPDIANRYNFEFDGLRLTCGGFLQSYNTEGGSDCGQFSDGRTAVIANTYEAGRTLLIGSHPSVSHFRCATDDSREYFARLLDWAKVEPPIRISNPNVQARLQAGNGRYLWLINAANSEQTDGVSLREGNVTSDAWHWGESASEYQDGEFPIAAQDAIIARLED